MTTILRVVGGVQGSKKCPTTQSNNKSRKRHPKVERGPFSGVPLAFFLSLELRCVVSWSL